MRILHRPTGLQTYRLMWDLYDLTSLSEKIWSSSFENKLLFLVRGAITPPLDLREAVKNDRQSVRTILLISTDKWSETNRVKCFAQEHSGRMLHKSDLNPKVTTPTTTL
ncbi:Uncharacterised protein at_DN1094 [Pycnogonum litorale]